MAARIYWFPTRKAKIRAKSSESRTAIADSHDLYTLAEEARRNSIIRTCRILEQRERSEADRGSGRSS
jgi:hypothetical protein